jgi:hypothetical protein
MLNIFSVKKLSNFETKISIVNAFIFVIDWKVDFDWTDYITVYCLLYITEVLLKN